MSMNKRFSLWVLLFATYGQAARSDTTSTQQITPTSCSGYFVPTTVSSTESSPEPSPVITAPAPPDPEVIIHQPVSILPPVNLVLNPQNSRRVNRCFAATHNCLTEQQSWPYLENMYADHKALLLVSMICFPPCWPVFAGIVIYSHFCNPPLNRSPFENVPSCCQQAFVFPDTTLGTLASLLTRHLNRPLCYSDILVLWLNHLMGLNRMLADYDALMPPPATSLLNAVVQGAAQVINITFIHTVQIDTSLAELIQYIASYSDIPATEVNHAYTDIVSIFIFPASPHQLIALHQTEDNIQWMIIPQLQFSESVSLKEGVDSIRRQFREMIQSSRAPDQPVTIIHFYVHR